MFGAIRKLLYRRRESFLYTAVLEIIFEQVKDETMKALSESGCEKYDELQHVNAVLWSIQWRTAVMFNAKKNNKIIEWCLSRFGQYVLERGQPLGDDVVHLCYNAMKQYNEAGRGVDEARNKDQFRARHFALCEIMASNICDAVGPMTNFFLSARLIFSLDTGLKKFQELDKKGSIRWEI